MKKLFLLPLLALTFLVNTPTASAFEPITPPLPSITLCHATSSEVNPYVKITVNLAAVINPAGHGAHANDIIPPLFPFYPGKNWDSDGQAIFNNNCQKPEPEPEPEPTLIRVCVDGEVKNVAKVEAGMTVLGEDEECPTPTTVTTVVEKEVIKEVEVVKEVPVEVPIFVETTVTETVEVPVPVTAPAPEAPVSAPTGELPRTGGTAALGWLGAGVSAIGVALRRLFK